MHQKYSAVKGLSSCIKWYEHSLFAIEDIQIVLLSVSVNLCSYHMLIYNHTAMQFIISIIHCLIASYLNFVAIVPDYVKKELLQQIKDYLNKST